MEFLRKLFEKKQEVRGNLQPVVDDPNPKGKMYTVIVVCNSCNHEYKMQLEGEGKHTFAKCPKCNGPVSSEYDQKGKKHSPPRLRQMLWLRSILSPPTGTCTASNNRSAKQRSMRR